MITSHWFCDAAAVKSYFRLSDYFAHAPKVWYGKLGEQLGLAGEVDERDFEMMCDNINPRTSERLKVLDKPGQRIALDLTFNSMKSVGLARELWGISDDVRKQVEEAHREAVLFTLGYVERDMKTRVRIAGLAEDRTTGNIVAMLQTHRETRPLADGKPDPSLHDHALIWNATYDPIEGRIKAAQMGDIKHDAPFYEAVYANRMASNLKQIELGIRRKGKSFEIAGISEELITKFSRRNREINAKADELGITDKSNLAATTRRNKVKAREDAWHEYLESRLTEEERDQLDNLAGQESYECSLQDAVSYAIGHLFERRSVVDAKQVYEAALRHGIGCVTPEAVEAEAKRQGLLVRDGQATTKKVLAQERYIVGFARAGRASMRPMGGIGDLSGLSGEQVETIRHIWNSADAMILIRGGAGTGKTTLMKKAIAGIRKPVAILAPSTDASRVVLRQEGFKQANTVAAFLGDEKWQESVRGGVIWVDEAGLLLIDDLEALCRLADKLGARIVLQGDLAQHRAVGRNGNMLKVLGEALPVAELKTIRRQQGAYAEAVEAIRDGDFEKGIGILDDLGWLKHGGHDDLVAEYEKALLKGYSISVVDPTHRDGDILTQKLRDVRKAHGLITGDEVTVPKYVQLGWTETEKRDRHHYQGDEVIYFFKKYKGWKAGDHVKASEVIGELAKIERFGVYREDQMRLAVGDTVRLTGRLRKENLDRGEIETVRRITDSEIELSDGRKLRRDFGLLDYGLVQTSFAAQSKTTDVVLTNMTEAAAAAISAEQAYVSVSRGRKYGMIFTDMQWDELLRHMRKTDDRISATEWLKRKKALADKKKRIYREWERKREAMSRGRERRVG